MADDSEQIGQDEIEKLLAQAQSGNAPPVASSKKPDAGNALGQDEIEAPLKGGGIPSPAPPAAPEATPAAPQAGATRLGLPRFREYRPATPATPSADADLDAP